MASPKYDILNLRYKDGSPAVMRHVDGSGFAYYPSGRKAICISASGQSKGQARRFGAIVHDDNARSNIVGCFDEWGRGYADGVQNQGDLQAPKVMFGEKEMTVIDGAGRITSAATRPKGTSMPSAGGLSELVLRMNWAVTLQHKNGRTTLDFLCESVGHCFVVGELHGDEVMGMPSPKARTLAEDTMRDLDATRSKLAGVSQSMAELRVNPSQKDTKPTFNINTASMKDVLDNLTTLSQSLSHPNLAPPNMQWNSELKLKKLIAGAHPQLPTQNYGEGYKKWSIGCVSGKCTEERLANVKPTATCPVTVELISQLKLPEVIDEHSSNNKLLVVICLASYAREPSNYAGMMAEKAQAELMKRYRGNALPVRFVSVELSELGLVAQQYGIREIPYCLMFQGGQLVHSKKLSGMKMTLRDGFTSRPSILLVESNPAAQLKLERTLRRNGYNSDLALDVPMALRLASRQTPYGVLLISSTLRVDQIRSIVSAVRRQQPKALILAYNSNMPSDEDVEVRKRFLDECTHVFLHIPGISALAAVLSRFDVTRTTFPHVGDNKMDFVEEILGVVERGHGPGPEQSPFPVHG